MRHTFLITLGSALFTTIAPITFAQEGAGAGPAPSPSGNEVSLSIDDRERLRAEIAPIVWWSSFGGDLSIAPGDAFELEDIDADEPNLAFGATARIDGDRFTVSISGFNVSFEDDNDSAENAISAGGLAIGAGAPVAWDVDLTSIKVTGGYRFRPVAETDDVSLRFDVYGGLRYTDVDIELRAAGGRASFDESWATPLIGARMAIELPHGFEVLVEGDLGYLPAGDTTAFGWEIFAGAQWNPTEHVGVRAGFRHLQWDYNDETDDGDNAFDAFLAGLYAGVVIRF